MRASELIQRLERMIADNGDLVVTNSCDAVIDDISVNEGSTEDYFTLEDSNYDILDVQNGEYGDYE